MTVSSTGFASDDNPYAPPTADLTPSAPDADQAAAEALRREHLNHETNLRGLGALWILGGIIGVPAGIVLAFISVGEATGAEEMGYAFGMAAFQLAVGVAVLLAGLDMRRLKPRARTTGTIASLLALINVPTGSLFGLFGLYLLHTKKGKTILTEHYSKVRAATPHIKYKTSIVVIVVALLLLAFLAFGILMAVFA